MSWLDSRMKREKAQALSRLPPSMAAKLKALPTSGPVDSVLEPIAERLKGIHYSWFQPAISRLPPAARELAERALPVERAFGIRELPGLLLEYWQSWLWRQIVEKDWLPQAMIRLPEDLKGLAGLSKHDLVEIIDLLGVFDVIPNLRKAIHATEQKFWGEVLSPSQKKFAQKLLQQPSWPGQLPIAIHSDSVPDAARALHQRGCLRLGAALSRSNESFIWSVVHQLDRGRGHLVQEAALESTAPEAVAAALGALQIVLRERPIPTPGRDL